jgi:hypothetical protein
MKSRKLSKDFLKPLITNLTSAVPRIAGARDAGMKWLVRYSPISILRNQRFRVISWIVFMPP